MPFPKIRIEGGPHGHDTKLYVDDELAQGVHRLRLDIDVKDAIRLRTYQFVEVDVQVSGKVETAYTIRVNHRDDEGRWQILAHATADTIWEGLADVARQMELQARRDAGVAQSGTIEEPSGRPPGH